MFDFEKLIVYQKARAFNKEIYSHILTDKEIPRDIRSQLDRASTSIMLNIAEGSGRYTKPDKRKFYVVSRASLLECVGAFQKLLDREYLDKANYLQLYNKSEEISKMLFKLIRSLE